MVTRADVNRLEAATSRLSAEAAGALSRFFDSVELGDPVVVRDALLEVVPAISSAYGDAAATVAAEWYEEVRAGDVGGRFWATLGELEPEAAVQGSVRWAAGELFTDNPLKTLDLLGGALQRHVFYGARATIARNVELDPLHPRFAVVPTGAQPCAWCVVMASRGWVYHSKATADKHSEFHDDCHCQVVPSWDSAKAHIQGYDPDRDYELYLAARNEAGPGEPLSKTVSRMKRQNPDLFGVKK